MQEALLGDTCAGCLHSVLPAADARVPLEMAKHRAVRDTLQLFGVVRSGTTRCARWAVRTVATTRTYQRALSWICFALGNLIVS